MDPPMMVKVPRQLIRGSTLIDRNRLGPIERGPDVTASLSLARSGVTGPPTALSSSPPARSPPAGIVERIFKTSFRVSMVFWMLSCLGSDPPFAKWRDCLLCGTVHYVMETTPDNMETTPDVMETTPDNMEINRLACS